METTTPEIPATSNKKLIFIAVICVLAGLSVGGVAAVLLIPSQKTAGETNVQLQASPTSAKLDASNPFVIGFISPLTGDGASYGIPAKQASIIVQKELNNNGGIGGREAKIVFEDGRCSAIDAENAAKKLLEVDKANLIYGGECSDEFLAVAPLAQQKKIFTTTGSATSPKVSELGKYIYRTVSSDTLGGKAAAQYAVTKMEAATAAVIAEKSSYGQALKEVFVKEFEKAGGKVLENSDFQTGTTNFSSFIQKVNSLHPDIVYLVPQTPTPGVLIIKALKDAKINTKILTAEVLLTRDEIPKSAATLEGLVGLETYFDETKPKAKHIIQLYEQEYGKENSYPTDLVAINDAFFVYKEAYEKVGNDPDKIQEYITTLNNWDGAAGPVKFDTNGDIVSLPYAIQTIKNKKLELLETYSVK
jgi:branched-chain amino acid transport system substrate-binding protein